MIKYGRNKNDASRVGSPLDEKILWRAYHNTRICGGGNNIRHRNKVSDSTWYHPCRHTHSNAIIIPRDIGNLRISNRGFGLVNRDISYFVSFIVRFDRILFGFGSNRICILTIIQWILWFPRNLRSSIVDRRKNGISYGSLLPYNRP